MADHMRDALAKLLDEYDARRRADVEREQRGRDENALFLTRFAELRRDVIRPVLEAAAEMLERRGHRCSITEQECVQGSGSHVTEAGIAMRVLPVGAKAALHEDQRSLSISTRHYNRTVWINSGEASGSGGLAGAKGAYTLERVTRQLVEDELVAFAARVLA